MGKWRILASVARGSILISLRHRDWGVFTCFKIVDQTRKLQPVSNISNVCFCLLIKELVINLHINLLSDKPLLPRTVMEQSAIPWNFSSYFRQ